MLALVSIAILNKFEIKNLKKTHQVNLFAVDFFCLFFVFFVREVCSDFPHGPRGGGSPITKRCNLTDYLCVASLFTLVFYSCGHVRFKSEWGPGNKGAWGEPVSCFAAFTKVGLLRLHASIVSTFLCVAPDWTDEKMHNRSLHQNATLI